MDIFKIENSVADLDERVDKQYVGIIFLSPTPPFFFPDSFLLVFPPQERKGTVCRPATEALVWSLTANTHLPPTYQ